MELDLGEHSLAVYRALSSAVRLKILRQIAVKDTTATQLAKQLGLTQSAVSKNLKLLLDSQLIHLEASKDGRSKILKLSIQDITIHLPKEIFPEYHQMDYSIPVGNYFSMDKIQPSCGLASEYAVIKRFDDPSTFFESERLSAQLLWFTSGEIEYQIPIQIPKSASLRLLDISFEAASEFPGSNNNWPSDIELWLNHHFVGEFHVAGNFSDVRGKYTPSWWRDSLSQYGTLIQLRVSDRNTGINGHAISDFNLNDLDVTNTDSIKLKFRIPVTPHNVPHGLTLFGKHFGNYAQDILVSSYYENR
jgi:predicted transcriptional regulator